MKVRWFVWRMPHEKALRSSRGAFLDWESAEGSCCIVWARHAVTAKEKAARRLHESAQDLGAARLPTPGQR